MKKIKLFYQRQCPFCKKAFAYLAELQEQPDYAQIEIERIEETEKPEIADQYDYYYVPTFYVDEKKVHEGGIYKEEVEALLRQALENR
ncbi:MAG: thioredoxin family protein [Alistipes sp.]